MEEESGHEGEALRDRLLVGHGEEEGGHDEEGEEGHPRHRREHLLKVEIELSYPILQLLGSHQVQNYYGLLTITFCTFFPTFDFPYACLT